MSTRDAKDKLTQSHQLVELVTIRLSKTEYLTKVSFRKFNFKLRKMDNDERMSRTEYELLFSAKKRVVQTRWSLLKSQTTLNLTISNT